MLTMSKNKSYLPMPYKYLSWQFIWPPKLLFLPKYITNTYFTLKFFTIFDKTIFDKNDDKYKVARQVLFYFFFI